MLALRSYPRLRFALEEYGAPRGLRLHRDAALPAVCAERAALAEAELTTLSDDDVVALASLDDEEHEAVALVAPVATDFVVLAWEGQLGRSVYR